MQFLWINLNLTPVNSSELSHNEKNSKELCDIGKLYKNLDLFHRKIKMI